MEYFEIDDKNIGESTALLLLYRENSGKLDAVIEKLNQLSSQMAVTNTRLAAMEESVSGLSKTVRGNNGTPGLVTEVALIKEAILDCADNGDEADPKLVTKDEAAKEHDAFISWKYVGDKFFVPIMIALILYLFLTFMPDLFAHLAE